MGQTGKWISLWALAQKGRVVVGKERMAGKLGGKVGCPPVPAFLLVFASSPSI